MCYDFFLSGGINCELALVFFFFFYKFLYKNSAPLWPKPTPRDHNLNKPKSTLPDDAPHKIQLE